MTVFRTTVPIHKLNHPINVYTDIFLIGSCFAENIAVKLNRYRMPYLCNPFGIVYNPIAITNQIKYALKLKIPVEDDFICVDGLYRNFDFHSKMVNESSKIAIDEINRIASVTEASLSRASHIVITLGTSLVYQLKSNNQIVANNHKQPAAHFNKIQLSINAVVESLQEAIDLIKQVNRNASIIFTISPVRHWRDGVVENNRSKAVLIEAVHQINENNKQACYFPAYEILLDELRDYRFYASDMLHPNDVAIDYIWQQFVAACGEKNMPEFIKLQDEINVAMEHKPFFPASEQHQKFKVEMTKKVNAFTQKYPNTNMDDALAFFK